MLFEGSICALFIRLSVLRAFTSVGLNNKGVIIRRRSPSEPCFVSYVAEGLSQDAFVDLVLVKRNMLRNPRRPFNRLRPIVHHQVTSRDQFVYWIAKTWVVV